MRAAVPSAVKCRWQGLEPAPGTVAADSSPRARLTRERLVIAALVIFAPVTTVELLAGHDADPLADDQHDAVAASPAKHTPPVP